MASTFIKEVREMKTGEQNEEAKLPLFLFKMSREI